MIGKTSFAVCLCLLFGATSALAGGSSWNGKIINTQDVSKIMTLAELTEALRSSNNVILGEKHYTAEIQAAQASIISTVVGNRQLQNSFTTAWEFLNFSSQKQISAAFDQYRSGQITAEDFLSMTLGSALGTESYVPILKATKDLGGHILGVNLSREEKAPVVKRGISGADPRVIPPGFAFGSQGYHDRFAKAMTDTGHATPEQIENYYAAECLTDDVIALHLTDDVSADLKFLVVGYFHTDFYDGTVGRIKIRAPQQKTTVIRFVDASDYSEADLLGISHDAQYGNVADYVFFVNEPGTQLKLETLSIEKYL